MIEGVFSIDRNNYELSPNDIDGVYEGDRMTLPSPVSELRVLDFYPELVMPECIELITTNKNLDRVHMPANTATLEIFSHELIDAVISAGTPDWKLVPVKFIDKKTREEVSQGRYSAVYFNEFCDCFDYDRSEYENKNWGRRRIPERYKEKKVGLIKKRAFLEPEDGYPSLFRVLAEPTRLYVSEKGRAAIENAKLEGISMEQIIS